ncbi:MAG: PQQ-dependent sugar dehydrogenase, partial [Anaerolineae bacterium]
AFAPDGRLFFSEIPGQISVIDDDRAQPRPFANVQEVVGKAGGLYGIAVETDFENNRYVYAFFHELDSWDNRVIRFREENGIGVEPIIVLEAPAITSEDRGSRHSGGNIHFGPDDKLYVTLGDYGIAPLAQDLDMLPGKILRLNRDGSAPEDNPFYTTAEASRSMIYAYGLRNSFDFTFDPFSGSMFATENGPECNDELNLIEAGNNYGWPLTEPCEPHPAGTVAPLRTYTPPIAPTGIVVYAGDLIPEWQGDLFFCDYLTGTLRRAELNEARNAITSVAKIDIPQRCQIDAEVGPDGALYFTSWNGGFGPGSIGSIYRISRWPDLFQQFLPLLQFQPLPRNN